MKTKLEIRHDRPLTWLLFLLLPEAVFGYFAVGLAMFALGAGEWSMLPVAAGMAMLFSCDLWID